LNASPALATHSRTRSGSAKRVMQAVVTALNPSRQRLTHSAFRLAASSFMPVRMSSTSPDSAADRRFTNRWTSTSISLPQAAAHWASLGFK